MEQKHHFIITRYCPTEQLFDGDMTFSEAHKFMDEHASFERRVGFKVFNDMLNRWEDYKDSYHGGRKVYDNKGYLYILDPDYRSMWRPENQLWHLWCLMPDGRKQFVSSHDTEERANSRRDNLAGSGRSDYKFVVEPSDIDISKL